VPIVVETRDGDVEKNATAELNRSSGEAPRVSQKRPLRLFLSYSHDDRKKQELFRKNLMALENDGYITFWGDPNIKAGMEWRPEIDRELEKMDVFVGLLTTNFVTSGFIQRVEFKRALERRRTDEVKLWMVVVDDRRIDGTPFEPFQLLKPKGRAVSQYKNLQAGFDAVEAELHRLVIDFWNSRPDTNEIQVRVVGRD
jgi:hypothetical protein